MQPILFIDRDGIILQEPPTDFQIDSINKTRFVPGAIANLSKIAQQLNFYHVMVTNQDGLGTNSFPEADFFPSHNLMLDTLAGEGFQFNEVHVDISFAAENLPTRKPGIAMVEHLLNNSQFNISESFVIGDRWSDIQLAKNLGCKAIYLHSIHSLTAQQENELRSTIALETDSWEAIFEFLKLKQRVVVHERNTNETKIAITLNVDGAGNANIQTGLGFFDHMLDQIARHGKMDLTIVTKGDLHIDEHHTIEDTGIALGEAFAKALTDKRGMERYGFALPMDEAEAKVLIDFGGRNWIVWDAEFKREKIGEMPTEMFFHFFKSFSDAAKCNLNISCKGDNEHHKIEAIFKAFAKAIRMAVKRDANSNFLPSTKGVL
ncbi:MAG: bifunctional histidinol-phosphatase/imidazoleglycerol-phosphate dehydratase HisB [Chitinophagaceae bacterium]